MFTYSDPISKTFSTATIKAMQDELHKLTEEYSLEIYPAEHRNHLGISVIGDDCARKLWYGFRWAKLEQFEGRMRRLFNRGHREEEEFVKLLMWMGFSVREIDPATNKQYKLSKLGGHYGGSSDSLALLPWFQNEDDRILVEYKTHNKKLFENLVKERLKISNPKHYAQMCGYGREFKTKYGLYCAKNKDNEEIYYEFVELDWNYAELLEKKAADIIAADVPPQRISDNPDYWKCKFCNFNGICHRNEPVEMNCRSCKMAIPQDNASWFCNRFQQTIPAEAIKDGCPQHVSINS